jgi:hypothetical protein
MAPLSQNIDAVRKRKYRARQRARELAGCVVTDTFTLGKRELDLLVEAGLLDPARRFNTASVSDAFARLVERAFASLEARKVPR